MNGKKRERRMAMRCIGAGVLAMCAATSYAGDTRDGACEEEDRADAQLTVIAGDEKRSKKLIKRHLPFGAHIGKPASQNGPTNEKLLVQAGQPAQALRRMPVGAPTPRRGHRHTGVARRYVIAAVVSPPARTTRPAHGAGRCSIRSG